MPRMILATPGETDWTQNGRYTGVTDLDLTPAGRDQVMATGTKLVGAGKLIDPARVACIWVSPRKRAQQTCHLLFNGSDGGSGVDIAKKTTLTEDMAEWDYGDYEGLKVGEARAQRKEKGLDRQCEWDIWRDGCEGGEYVHPYFVRSRLDKVVLVAEVIAWVLAQRRRSLREWIALLRRFARFKRHL